ncbi:patatin-like phospholipase domain-containing protein [Pochonia chlamydosporia 170]|uniref:Patatin-like phospholipase domain-containing protein n=1 Tax=Pochonia chlamydosporia 170 TaxID=1380566 RepID=A0A179FPS6_METCM|nr:patatin-like phospholipase domain-containing protein [Pochonia chlamydosporia 170]OAQ67009.1 patatin-like phospholipase domain-containing protein [Pochonia chlamydosporia 170]
MPLGEHFDMIVGTTVGGLIALGLGIHNFNAQEMMRHFRSLCRDGMERKALTKSQWFGWAVRLLTSSIYKTYELENALKAIFGTKTLFGYHNGASKVAVTTTVSAETRLLANYHWGDDKRYLNADVRTWLAARCTSAAPMYFESGRHDGVDCRDGGLIENNPLQIAVNEARKLWGTDASFDIVTSIGCGKAYKPQPAPTSTFVISGWVEELFKTLIETMNGHKAWEKFYDDSGNDMLDRCERLNVLLKDEIEPELDDVSAISRLEDLAKSYYFHYQPRKGQFRLFQDE